MLIRPLRVHDDADLESWWDVWHRAEVHERPFASPYMLEEVRATMREPVGAVEHRGYVGEVAGSPVSAGSLDLPHRDNLRKAELHLWTAPEHRRRGYGAAMLAHLEGVAFTEGRDLADAVVDFAYDHGPEGRGDPGVELLRKHGWHLGVSEVQRTLDLPVHEDRLAALAAEAAAHHRDYVLRSWTSRCPDDLVDSYADLIGLLEVEAPTGDLEMEARAMDAERVRRSEGALRNAARRNFVTAAVAGDGTVVAYTEMVWPEHDPGKVYQWGTLVHREHRGHRLGLAVKVANHQAFQRERPGRHVAVTFNAGVNDHMIAVNEALGFQPSARGAELQKRLRP